MIDKSHFNSSPGLRGFVGGLLLGVAIVLAAIVGAYGFAHPDMTRTRVFLNMWPVELGAVLAVVLAAILRNSDE
jgi:hypothetical protein